MLQSMRALLLTSVRAVVLESVHVAVARSTAVPDAHVDGRIPKPRHAKPSDVAMAWVV